MKVRLHKIYVSEELGIDSVAFHADLYINGTRVGTAENIGDGQATIYGGTTEESRRLIKEGEEWCKCLAPLTSRFILIDNKPISISMNLGLFIDNLIAEHVAELDKRRYQKKMELDMVDAVLFGSPEPEIRYRSHKLMVSIPTILTKDLGIMALQALIHEKILPDLKDGEKILNTNIPYDLLMKMEIPADKIMLRAINKLEKRRSKDSFVKGKVMSRRKKKENG
jgi:hypothetical protein